MRYIQDMIMNSLNLLNCYLLAISSETQGFNLLHNLKLYIPI